MHVYSDRAHLILYDKNKKWLDLYIIGQREYFNVS
jgi:hypothetical protein